MAEQAARGGASARVVIGEAHRLIGEALAEALVAAGHEVTATITTIAELPAALATAPDACLLHAALPRHHGMRRAALPASAGRCRSADPAGLVRSVRAVAPCCRVVLRADHDDPRLRRSGAAAVIAAHASLDTLTRTVARVARDRPVSRRSAAGPSVDRRGPLRRLTGRERTVLAMLADGASTGDIAAALGIRRETVRSHVRAVLSKLGVHSRVAAVAAVAAAGELDALLTTPRPAISRVR